MRKSESQGSFTGERWRRLSCKLAEGEGFEPPRGLRPGGFQEQGRAARNHAVSRNGTELDPPATLVLIGSCRAGLHPRGHKTGTPHSMVRWYSSGRPTMRRLLFVIREDWHDAAARIPAP